MRLEILVPITRRPPPLVWPTVRSSKVPICKGRIVKGRIVREIDAFSQATSPLTITATVRFRRARRLAGGNACGIATASRSPGWGDHPARAVRVLRIGQAHVLLCLLTLIGTGCSASTGNGGSPLAADAAAGLDGSPPSEFDSGVSGPEDSSAETGQSESDAPVVSANPDAGDALASAPVEAQAGGCAGLFCEDFEQGALDPLVWSARFNGRQTAGVVQTATVAHGKYAMRFHAVNSDRAYSFIITKSAPAGLRGHHFGRAYFYVTPMPPAMHTEFLFSGTSGFPMLKYLEVAGIGNAWQLTFVDLATGGAESYHSGGSIPLARWVCLEWEFTDTPDQATAFVDGTLSYTTPNGFSSGGRSTGLVGPFTDFGFGFYAWHPATYDFDVYYDDIVLDTKRVGCLP